MLTYRTQAAEQIGHIEIAVNRTWNKNKFASKEVMVASWKEQEVVWNINVPEILVKVLFLQARVEKGFVYKIRGV